MDKNVLDKKTTPLTENQIRELRIELESLDLLPRIQRIMECMAILPESERLRLDQLRSELEGQSLVELLIRLMADFKLSQLDTATAAGVDPAVLGKILRGERRQLQQEQVDNLLEDLWQTKKISDPTLLLTWHRALRVAAVMHSANLKDIEPRLKNVTDPMEKVKIVQAYFDQMFPSWANLYDATKGQVPVLFPPFALSAAEQLLANQGMLYQVLRGRRTTSFIEPDLVHVPSGYFWMGSDDREKGARDDEKPCHRVHLPGYWIGRYSVTNEEYQKFLRANPQQDKPGNWDSFNFPQGQARHPVRYVSWKDAMGYCRWLSSITGKTYTLPNEAQWEKAARGADGRIYPWGNKWDPAKCNCEENKNTDGTTPVGQFPPNQYGLYDMAGNVWDWTLSLYRDYPYNPRDGRNDSDASGVRVLRGGSWYGSIDSVRCAYRGWDDPRTWNDFDGFRCCCATASLSF